VRILYLTHMDDGDPHVIAASEDIEKLKHHPALEYKRRSDWQRDEDTGGLIADGPASFTWYTITQDIPVL
jgi:hypothetical protein